MKVAVIGAGTMGSGIAQAFAQCSEVEKVYLCDIKVEFAEGETSRTYEYKATANGNWDDYVLPAGDNANFVFGTQQFAIALRQISHLVDALHMLLVEPLSHLPGCESRHTQTADNSLQLCRS